MSLAIEGATRRIGKSQGYLGLCVRDFTFGDGIARALGVDDNSFRTMPIVYGEKRKPACVVVTLTPTVVSIPVIGVIK